MRQSSTAKQQNWTVMIYMAGDNNLSDRCVDDLREIAMAGLTRDVTVKVQVDRSSAYENSPARYTVPGTLWGQSNPSPNSLDPYREDWSQPCNTGKEEPLWRFINWGMKDRPDDRYMLVLWGHATPMDAIPLPALRWRKKSRKRDFRRGRNRRSVPSTQRRNDDNAFFKVCTDDSAGDALTNIELQNVLKKVKTKKNRPIDILGLDACLMCMVELCYEMRDYAKLMIASESLIPSMSWPYHWILSALRENPTMSPEDLSRTIVSNYVLYYADYDASPVQLSACNLSKCEDLKRAVRGLAGELIKRLKKEDLALRNAILSAHFRAQPYSEEQYYDLYDFCYMLKESCDESDIDLREACERVMSVVVGTEDDGFVLSSQFGKDDLQFSYGASIYLPWAEVSPRYGALEFARKTNWNDFLKLYTEQTSKEPRSDRDATR